MNDRRIKPFSAPPFPLAHPHEDPHVMTLPVPGYRQARNYCCGFAAALMVLRHFERALCGQQLFEALGTARDGTGQGAIVRVLRSQGLRANLRYDMNFERFASSLQSGKVLIGYLGDEEHWLVIYGYGRSPQRVYVADPEPGKTCEQRWDTYGPRLGAFAMVCSPARADRAVAPRVSRSEPAEQLRFDFGAGR